MRAPGRQRLPGARRARGLASSGVVGIWRHVPRPGTGSPSPIARRTWRTASNIEAVGAAPTFSRSERLERPGHPDPALGSHRAAHLRRCMLWLRMHKRTPRNHPTTTEARQQVNSNDGSEKLVIQMKRLRSFVYTRSALSGLLRNTAWWPDQAIRVR